MSVYVGWEGAGRGGCRLRRASGQPVAGARIAKYQPVGGGGEISWIHIHFVCQLYRCSLCYKIMYYKITFVLKTIYFHILTGSRWAALQDPTVTGHTTAHRQRWVQEYCQSKLLSFQHVWKMDFFFPNDNTLVTDTLLCDGFEPRKPTQNTKWRIWVVTT